MQMDELCHLSQPMSVEEAKGYVLRRLFNGQYTHVSGSKVVELLEGASILIKPDKAIAQLILEDLARQGFCVRHDQYRPSI